MNFNVKKGQNTFATVIDHTKIKKVILQITSKTVDESTISFSLLDVALNTIYYFTIYGTIINYDRETFETDFTTDKNIVDYYIKDNEFLIYYTDVLVLPQRYGYGFRSFGEANIVNLQNEINYINFEGFEADQPFTYFLKYSNFSFNNLTFTIHLFSVSNAGYTDPKGFKIFVPSDGGLTFDVTFNEINSPFRNLTYKALKSNFFNSGIIQITYDGLKNSNSLKHYNSGNLINISQYYNTGITQTIKPTVPLVQIGRQYVGNPIIENTSIVNFVKTTEQMSLDRLNGFQQKGDGDYLFNLVLNQIPGTTQIPAIIPNNERTLFSIETGGLDDFVPVF
jgi:hypothetical protein